VWCAVVMAFREGSGSADIRVMVDLHGLRGD